MAGRLPDFGAQAPGLGTLRDPYLTLVFVLQLLPVLSLGSAVCRLLLEARGRDIGRMYGADLLGATVGALLVVPLLHVVPTPLLFAGEGVRV